MSNYSTGQWVVVTYDGETFPGEITSCDTADIEINVMHKSGRYWKWPETVDKIFYELNKLYAQLPLPK